MQAELFTPRLNQADAPIGYYALLKSDAKPKDGGNICRACDFRLECPGVPIDQFPSGHNCRSHELVGTDGKLYARADGCSVVFKRLDRSHQ